MKKILITFSIFLIVILTNADSNSQTKYFSKPKWTIGIGGAWLLATNDAYGRANYSSQDQILKDNYGMRWGIGAYLFGKYAPGKRRNDRIYLSADYKMMKNADMDASGNETKYDIVTFSTGYEYLFYSARTKRKYTYTNSWLRAFVGAGLTGNLISGEYTPNTPTMFNVARTFESTFRVGMELKSGLELMFKNRKLGLQIGGRYNLMNLFNDDNVAPLLGQTTELNLNDGDGASGPGFKRWIGIFSFDIGLNIYPGVKRMPR